MPDSAAFQPNNESLLPVAAHTAECTVTRPGLSSNDLSSEDLSNAASASSHARMLLEALQNYIIPLIQTSNGQSQKDFHQPPASSPEAVKFLAALHELVSSMILQSQVGNADKIEVDLQDQNTLAGLDYLEETSHWLWVSRDGVSESRKEDIDPLDYLEDAHWLWNVDETAGQPKNLQRLQAALREHIFSTMPIRVLHFDQGKYGSKLQINLLDRNGIYSHLAKRIEEEYSEKAFQEKVIWCGGVENAEAEDIVIKEWVKHYSRYAILSHTWIRGPEGEVTYTTWNTRKFDTQQPGYQKLANFCKAAWNNHDVTFGWTDTVCINKESSSELDESIRSMYKWYRNADICITYLARTSFLSDIRYDPWFTRGWTFQELLAPQKMIFYNMDWDQLNSDKFDDNILEEIAQATTITYDELYNPQNMPISRKMQLAAKREVTREEDAAYSLMGICNVSISIAYGEGGKRAFFRLMMEILTSSSHVLDVFNCTLPPNHSSSEFTHQQLSCLIPPGPLAYSRRSEDFQGLARERPIEPLMLTHLGLRISVLLMPALEEDYFDTINDPIGDYYASVSLVKLDKAGSLEEQAFKLLDKRLGICPRQDGSTWTLDGMADNIASGYHHTPLTDTAGTTKDLLLEEDHNAWTDVTNNKDMGSQIDGTSEKFDDTGTTPSIPLIDKTADIYLDHNIPSTDITTDVCLDGNIPSTNTTNDWNENVDPPIPSTNTIDNANWDENMPSTDKNADSDEKHHIHWTETTFGVLNIGGDKNNVEVPNTCLAIGFLARWNAEWESTSTYIARHDTHKPIVFELKKRDTDRSQYAAGHSIKRSELAKHGMKLVTM